MNIFETLQIFIKGAKTGFTESQMNLSLIIGYFSALLMLLPLFEWVFVPERLIIYNVFNTFLLPIILVTLSVYLYFGVRNFDKEKELDSVSEFIRESWMKIKFMPLYFKRTLFVLTICFSIFGSFFFFLTSEVSFTFYILILLWIAFFLMVYFPLVLIIGLVDFFRNR